MLKTSIKTTLGILASATLITMTPTAGITADETRIPVMSQADRAAVNNLPGPGQSKFQVRESFGSPAREEGPVGQPPITEWHYPDFIVYFEHDRVIHAVVKPQ